ncbi:MAG: hypothetical protein V2I47_00660 [Bacteroidales bacterium]|jgi:hypothetical protein|nr:hypothetical protein [Bacteroidales bacterium]
MYELSQNLCALFLESTEKIYAKSSVEVTIYTTEDIPQPTAQDIIILDKGSLGKDITIRLNVTGTISEEIQTKSLTIPVPVIDVGHNLNEQGVRDEIGPKVYNVTVKVYKNNTEKSSNDNNVDKKSEVELG